MKKHVFVRHVQRALFKAGRML